MKALEFGVSADIAHPKWSQTWRMTYDPRGARYRASGRDEERGESVSRGIKAGFKHGLVVRGLRKLYQRQQKLEPAFENGRLRRWRLSPDYEGGPICADGILGSSDGRRKGRGTRGGAKGLESQLGAKPREEERRSRGKSRGLTREA